LGDKVFVHFIGTFEDGTVFSDTRRANEPYSEYVGVGLMIGGWDGAIPTMMKGERALFTMHPSVAYGEQGAGFRIPPNATVRFDIELLGFDELDDLGSGLPGEVDPDYDPLPMGREDLGLGGTGPKGIRWERHGLEIIVKVPLPDNVTSKDIHAEFYQKRVLVSVQGEVLLRGTPGTDLDREECFWEIQTEEEFEGDPVARPVLWVHLMKMKAERVRWPRWLFKEHAMSIKRKARERRAAERAMKQQSKVAGKKTGN